MISVPIFRKKDRHLTFFYDRALTMPDTNPHLISEQLARFVVWTKFEDIPTELITKAQRHILDSVGAGIAGAVSPETRLLNQVFTICGEQSGDVPLWGKGIKVSARNAALSNGVSAHTFELDDTNGCDHSGAVVVPAAFAALSLCDRPITGKEFIVAIVLGYDLARRALESCGAYEPHNGAGWHSTGTCGVFGATAAVGRLLGLDVEKMQAALGIATSFAAGQWSFVHDGAQNKRLHVGNASHGGLLACLLAREGFTGPKMAFEEVWGGFSKTFAPESQDPDAWLRDLGKNWKLGRVSIKPHASCRSSHSSIDAVNIIMAAKKLEPADIAKIHIKINPFVHGMCGGRKLDPMPAAQMSIAYGIAARLVFGAANLTAYTRTNRHDARIRRGMDLVEFEIDPTQKDDDEPIVTIHTTDGRSFTECVQFPLGAPQNPVSDEALMAKYRDIAGMVFSNDIVEAIADFLLNLQHQENLTPIMKLLGSKPIMTNQFDI